MKYRHRQRLKRLLCFCCMCFLLSLVTCIWIFFPSRSVNTLPVFFISSDESFQFIEDYGFGRWSHIQVRVGQPIRSSIAQDIALVIRDDVIISDTLFEEWEKIILTAPSNWDILQMWTNNPTIVSHCETLDDPWISWFPEHLGDSAYFIRKEALPLTRDQDIDFSQWNTYTTTRFFVESTMLKEQHPKLQKWPVARDSVLLLMSTTIEDVDSFDHEMKRWRADFEAVYVDWYVSVIVRNEEMRRWILEHWPVDQRLTLHVDIVKGQYNKFVMLKGAIPRMIQYERVLFKDADMNIAGFAWRTFIRESKGAIISSCLRQRKVSGVDDRQWFKFQDGSLWKKDYPDMFGTVAARESVFLEQFFVMMDGDFASWFFKIILSEEYLTDLDGNPIVSNWGPDVIWCGAAASWTSEKTPCVLVPIISKHDDTQQVALWNSSPRRKYANMQQLAHFEKAFPQWLFYNRTNLTH